MKWSAMPRAAPCARSHSSAHSASSGSSSVRYQARSSSTRCGVDCTPRDATAADTVAATRVRMPAASLDPCASSAAGRRNPTKKMASRRKKGSFQRRPSPERLLEKSRGTRRPSGQCSSDLSGCRIRSTSSNTRVPPVLNSFTISAATAPSLRSATSSSPPSPPASATRSLRLRASDAPSNSRVRKLSPAIAAAPSSCATKDWSSRCAHSRNLRHRLLSAVGVVTTMARAARALRRASSGAGVSGVKRSKRRVSTERRTTPAKAARRQLRLNSSSAWGTTCTTSMLCVASMKPSSGHTTVVLPSPMSICAHSAPPPSAAAVKSRTSPTCRSRRMMD
mmetsp:Transcript_39049/g.96749  ORF Transcript_39049/g.96749 Transcript_39049/m.96749 type:complete len:336 (-) Transcript_39049:166-1173(-)